MRSPLSLLRSIAAVLLLASPMACLAAAPTAADIAAIKPLLGYDQIAEGAAAPFKKQAADYITDPTARACVVGEFVALIDGRVDVLVGQSFGSSERIGEWLAFSRTVAGAKFIGHVRAGFTAVIAGREPATMESFRATLTPVERKAVADFIAASGEPLTRLRGSMGRATDAEITAIMGKCNIVDPSAK